jgi:hypothetical protein
LEQFVAELSFPQGIVEIFRRQVFALHPVALVGIPPKDPLLPGEEAMSRRHQLSNYFSVRSAAFSMATRKDLELVMIHWPVPHLPGIYNRRQKEFTVETPSNYLDNLELADRSFGDIRTAMEKAGLWDRTTVIVTSDHPLRPGMWTEEEARLTGKRPGRFVPFLIKPAGQLKGLICDVLFDTILLHDLVLEDLKGNLSSAQELAQWIRSKSIH